MIWVALGAGVLGFLLGILTTVIIGIRMAWKDWWL